MDLQDRVGLLERQCSELRKELEATILLLERQCIGLRMDLDVSILRQRLAGLVIIMVAGGLSLLGYFIFFHF